MIIRPPQKNSCTNQTFAVHNEICMRYLQCSISRLLYSITPCPAEHDPSKRPLFILLACVIDIFNSFCRRCGNLLLVLLLKAMVIFPEDCSVFTSSPEAVTCCYSHTGSNLLIPELCICLTYIALSVIHIVDTHSQSYCKP